MSLTEVRSSPYYWNPRIARLQPLPERFRDVKKRDVIATRAVLSTRAAAMHLMKSTRVIEARWVASKGSHVDTSLQNFNQPEPGGGRGCGGWSLGGIVSFASGFPFNVVQSGDTWNADALWPWPNAVAGQKPVIDDRTPTRW